MCALCSVPSKEVHERQVSPKFKIPKLFCYSGRTAEAVKSVLLQVGQRDVDIYLYNLMSEQSVTPLNLFPYRGYSLAPVSMESEVFIDVQVSCHR